MLRYRFSDDNIVSIERSKRHPFGKVIDTVNPKDVSEIDYSIDDSGTLHILLKSTSGDVIFDINRDVIYSPQRENPPLSRFHQQFWECFVVPVSTSQVYSTVDLETLVPQS